MPVLTPRYFQSVECRRELQAYAQLATDLGVKDLILPLLYVDFVGLHDKNTKDELIKLVNTFQWEIWTDIRFMAVDSEGYRRGVAKLASKIVAANNKAEGESLPSISEEETPEHKGDEGESLLPISQVEVHTTIPSNLVAGITSESPEEKPGFIDSLAEFEEKLEKTPQTLQEITQEINTIGSLMREATAEITDGPKTKYAFSNRILIIKKLSQQLQNPIERIWTLTNELSSQLHSIDTGYRILIERAPIEIENDPNNKATVCNLFETIRNFVATSNEALQGIQHMIRSTKPLDEMSRDLRPLMRRLRQGLTLMLELELLGQDWLKLINESKIECNDINS